MKKVLLAGVAAVAILGSSAVYAQHRFHHHHHHERLSAEDRAAFVDAKIASVKAGLQLTPDQDKLWGPVETAVRDFAKQRIALSEARAKEWEARRAEREQKADQKGDQKAPDQAAKEQTFDPVARLRDRADRMATTAAGLKKIADAADPLYKSLDDKQKRRLSMLTHFGGMHRGGWRERGSERGLERDGDWGGGRFDRHQDHERDHDHDNGGSERL